MAKAKLPTVAALQKAWTLAELTDFYNRAMKELGRKPVKGFKDKPTAAKRARQAAKEVEDKLVAEVVAKGFLVVRKKGDKRSSKLDQLAKINIILPKDEKGHFVNPKQKGSLAEYKAGVLIKFHGKTVKEFLEEEGHHPIKIKGRSVDDEIGWARVELNWFRKVTHSKKCWVELIPSK